MVGAALIRAGSQLIVMHQGHLLPAACLLLCVVSLLSAVQLEGMP